MKRRYWASFTGLLVFYVAISLHNLANVPMVYEDEPWQASTGWKLAQQGVFGSDMFAGWHGMDQHYYGFMPLHPLALAVVFRVLGLGVGQARTETVLVGLAVLVGTFALARRLFPDPRIGLFALLFLLSVRLTGTNPSSVSGILLIDMARIARYDMFVPAFGIAALHLWIYARDSGRLAHFALAGALAALSGLGHLYGVFWLPVLVVSTVWQLGPRGSTRPVFALAAGFVVPWIPYVAYVMADLEGFSGQTSEYLLEGRLDIWDPRWYLANAIAERERYKVGLGHAGFFEVVRRVGLWSTALALPASLVALARRARGGDGSTVVVLVPALLLPTLFALTLHIKMMNYILAFMPMWAIAVAWGGVTLWGRLATRGRIATMALGAAVLAEGASRVYVLEEAAATTSPYAAFIARVHDAIPAGARVLGLPNYWYGLEDVDYRSFVVPAYLAGGQPAVPFDQGIEAIHPDVLLLDDRMRSVFDHPTSAHGDLAGGYARWRDRHAPEPFAVVDDATYGRIEFWRPTR